MAPRVLILTASVGEGHDRPARLLDEQLRREQPSVDVTIVDCLPALGRVVAGSERRGAAHRLLPLPLALGSRLLGLRRLGPSRQARATAADPTRHAGAAAADRRSRSRRDRVGLPDCHRGARPAASLGPARHPGRRRRSPISPRCTTGRAAGVDVHLVTHPESVAEVRGSSARRHRVHCVHGFTSEEFLDPREQTSRAPRSRPARTRQGRRSSRAAAGASGTSTARSRRRSTLHEVTKVVCLCGRNETLRSTVRRPLLGRRRACASRASPSR